MEILLVRHGVAEDLSFVESNDKRDFDRALTLEGRQEMEKVAQGLSRVIPTPDALFASPLVRAQQTAQILALGLNLKTIETEDALESETSPEETANRIAHIVSGKELIVCVGHQPNLGALVSYLIAGTFSSPIAMGRGAACLIRFRNGIIAGRGTVRFHAPRWIW